VIVNHWVPAAHAGDAIGSHVLRFRDALRDAGHESDIFALQIDDALTGDVEPFDDARARQGDVTILQMATRSVMSHDLGSLPGLRVLQYQNITPAPCFAPYDAHLAAMAVDARRELAALADRVDLAIAPSEYSRAELDALGFRQTSVMPIAIDLDRLRSAPSRPALETLLADGLANILFVGRLAPNKKIEDHLRLAEHYKRYVDAGARFIFVGRTDAAPAYFRTIQGLLAEYRLPRERFLFTGPVPDADLAAYYRHAHVYVSLSEHEGFGVPLVEAMAMDVPVVAFAATAVPETLGGAGLAFAPKDLELAAELVGAAVYDASLRAQVIAGQRARLDAFAPDRFRRHVADFVDACRLHQN
jgi:glycosyltransferase involved in cell wall biosynthesis